VRQVAARLLALSIPLVFAMTGLVGHLRGGFVPLDLAWILLGFWLWSESHSVT